MKVLKIPLTGYFLTIIQNRTGIKNGKDIIISAHGNSLRALIMYLEGLSKEEILKTEIPTGSPKNIYLTIH
ncbi:MAG: hypothetical protein IPM38_01785 [Ignavibacteria bacterium]|nr:hypothetical protein [Ignavibacteria bacterium]